jgi:demethylsterigmatocystin 6-O-methyltransferase
MLHLKCPHSKNVIALTSLGRFDIMGPAIQAAPSFLADTKYQDITNSRNTPFQKAFKTELAAFDWVSQQPKLFAAMQQVMTMMQGSQWLVEFDALDEAARALEKKTPSQEFERPFFVDVGGGHGHQLVQLRDKYPHLKGSLILQDLPEAVEQLPPIEGVNIVAQNFFDKQGIEGRRSG